ncbi:MAG: ATP-binding protein [Planctomycetaceae bacterium]
MITLIEALNYRCLRYIRQPMDRFHVLVGPNASGKTTFLDVIEFLGSIVNEGLEEAFRKRSPDPRDLLFRGKGDQLELAIESLIPRNLCSGLNESHSHIRYEISISISQDTGRPSIRQESLMFKGTSGTSRITPSLFPEIITPPSTIVTRGRGVKRILSKNERSGKDNYYPEIKKGEGGGWMPSFQLGPNRSSLANLPEDETRFPVATWFKDLLSRRVQNIILDSLTMRKASPPGQSFRFKTDGSNLPWVVEDFKKKNSEAYQDWINHLQMALPDLVGVRTVERNDDKHRYMVLKYSGGFETPSWTASDGTLRLLALTLPAYLPNLDGIYLIEEPENGIHPKAVETLYQSISNVYDAQMLLATHSPVILSLTEPSDVLCFAKDESGATDIISGDQHPQLTNWQHDVSLGDLFAAGVLG